MRSSWRLWLVVISLSFVIRTVDAENEQVYVVNDDEDEVPDDQLVDLKMSTSFDGESEKELILLSHDDLDTSDDRHYKGITLAYVTPWNNHGYDVVKWAAKKFTHISPVWFNVDVSQVDNPCVITGQHDIDKGWMSDILANNSAIKFVPRFLFNSFSKEGLEAFVSSETVQDRCGRNIVEFLKSVKFDGAVLEIWLQVMSRTRGSAEIYLLELIESWGKMFRAANLKLILPLTPPLDHSHQPIGIFSSDILAKLSDAVDYVNLMTYDYTGPEAGPVAPIDWSLANLNYMIQNGFEPSKILFGLNWYGYDRTGGDARAILGRDFIEYLSDPDSILEYDEKADEYRVTWNYHNVAYFPTTKSIEFRLEIAEELGLGGIGIWEIGQGLDHFTFVL